MSLESLFHQVTSPDRPFYLYPMYWVLGWVSWVYAAIQRLRGLAYDRGWLRSRRLSVPVISVGNLTLGGTGKTPMVIWMAEALQQMGWHPAILSRGYGGDPPEEVNVVSDGHAVLLDPEIAGDEPVMMARRLPGVPVLTGLRRFRLGRHAQAALGADALILDDGYQHLPLKRDLNLLLLDHRYPAGNGRVFPAGELREPMAAAGRADAVILTRYQSGNSDPDLSPWIQPGRPLIKTTLVPDGITSLDGGEAHPVAWLSGKTLAAFCGIAQPDDFFEGIERAGARLVVRQAFPDHFDYASRALDGVVRRALELHADGLITTEKDAVKLSGRIEDPPLWVLRMRLEFVDGEEALMRLVTRCFQNRTVPAG